MPNFVTPSNWGLIIKNVARAVPSSLSMMDILSPTRLPRQVPFCFVTILAIIVLAAGLTGELAKNGQNR
jgi:hypothetical protein